MLDAEREYQALMTNAPVGILYTKNGEMLRHNAKFSEIFGFDSEVIGMPARLLLPTDADYESLGRLAGPILSSGKPFHHEIQLRHHHGHTFWADAVAYIVDPERPAEGTIWIINDISERKQAERNLHETLQELQSIFNNASVGIVFTGHRTVLRSNRRFEEIVGYSSDELRGMATANLHASEESHEELNRQSSPLLSAGKSFSATKQFRRKDGHLIWCQLFAKAIDPNDPSRGIVWITADITEAVSTRDALEKSSREMEALMANSSVGIVVTRDRKIVRYNQRFGNLFGFPGENGIGVDTSSLYRSAEEHTDLNRRAAPALFQAKPFQTELYMRRQDGSDIWINLIGYVADASDPSMGVFWIAEDRTAFKHAEEELKKAYLDQRLIFDHCVAGIAFIKNRVFQQCNRRFEELYGYGPGELTGKPTRITYFSEKSHTETGAKAYEILGRGETFVAEIVHRRQNGDPIWLRITGRAIDPAHPNDGSIWNYEDITSRKVAEESLRESVMLQRAILNSAKLMILSTDSEGRVISSNPATEQMLGYSSSELLGRTPVECFFLREEVRERRRALTSEIGFEPVTDIDALLARVRLGSVDQGHWTFQRKDGEKFTVELSISALHPEDRNAQGFLFVASDITERKRAEDALLRSRDELELRVKERTSELESEVLERRRIEGKLRYLAHHDALTGLANRTLLQQRLGEAMENAAQEGTKVAVLFIDLDRFKTINDSLGHHIGDTLLKRVASRLTETLRSNDTIARLGGDEFMIVLPFKNNEAQAGKLASKILDSLRPPIRIDGHELFVTPSIGICFYPNDGVTVNALMRNADTAMYQAKANGRNTYCYFTAEMNAAADNYFQIESDLRRAIDRNEFEVHYQPVINLKTHRITSYEALVRWNHPTKGLVGPAQFITVAEESGLIGEIGTIVLRHACSQLRSWIDQGLTPPILALNLSPIQFNDPKLTEGICGVLADYDLTPDRIELEITETVIMQDGELALGTLQNLSSRGFRLSIDDFGTGYSSLAYLKRFPVDTLKIDRSFITDMTVNENDRAIVTAIMALANSLHLSVIAEGVETKEQYDALSALNCNFAQGYYMAKPMPANMINLDASIKSLPID
ncbi:MAG: diguanylate cyclase/phosphodiesterase with sensor(s) [Proteobacteria bacterium]|nr:diguanylate cyclase/phosphodiesterase with sensor(s) [Pseudomonadota bacterium]